MRISGVHSRLAQPPVLDSGRLTGLLTALAEQPARPPASAIDAVKATTLDVSDPSGLSIMHVQTTPTALSRTGRLSGRQIVDPGGH
jgi:hypothetical protein